MAKKILILEPSSTIQKLFTDKLKKSDVELTFETNGVKFLWSLFSNVPDVILINAKTNNPKSIELVRLIKTMDKLKTIPVALFATSDYAFENFFMKNCGADSFIHVNQTTLVSDINLLVSLSGSSALSIPVQSDIMKDAIMSKLFSLAKNLDSVEKIVEGFVDVVTEFCEVPAAAVYLIENGTPTEYYVTGINFTETETKEFLTVCTDDFEKMHPDLNLSKIVPQKVHTKNRLDSYRTGTIPLSSYQCIGLTSELKENIGMLSIVKEGNFTARQLDLVKYCANQCSLILENAILMKKKNQFEKRVRKAFSRFVPEQIIDQLVDEADTSDTVASGEKRVIAILFSDIRSFTSISELNKPETIVAFLNRYFTIMVNIIKKHGGTIDKFIGDAIMALFGAPVSYEDNARRAVAAAYEMRQALPSVPLEDLVMPEGMQFNIGIGIHYGDVTVGSIGSADKTDYTVIGDSVNLASRLEGLTKTYGVQLLVSEDVKNDIKGTDFIFRYLDDVKVKGKTKGVPIYAVDRNQEEFSIEYRDCYAKGLDLYKQGVFNLAKEYFEKSLAACPNDKASKLMLERCEEFIKNPPESWDGAITFHTK